MISSLLWLGIEHKAYNCYDHITKLLRISRHIQFQEHMLFTNISSVLSHPLSLHLIFIDPSIDFSLNADACNESLSNDHSQFVLPQFEPLFDPTTSESSSTLEILRFNRVRTPPTHLNDYHYFSAIAALHELRNYRDASSDLFGKMLCLMNFRPSSKLLYGTQLIYLWISLQQGVNGCTRLRHKLMGFVERYKACLMAQRFTKEYGID